MPRARKEKNQIAFCFSSFVFFAQTLFLLKKKSRILSAVPSVPFLRTLTAQKRGESLRVHTPFRRRLRLLFLRLQGDSRFPWDTAEHGGEAYMLRQRQD